MVAAAAKVDTIRFKSLATPLRLRAGVLNLTSESSPLTSAISLSSGAAGSPLTYHGGYVLSGTINIYNIYFGSLPASTTQLLEYFLTNVGTSQWYTVFQSYGIKGSSISLKQRINIQPQRNIYTSNDAIRLIINILSLGLLPVDPNGIYLLFFTGVTFEGMCSYWCGSHGSFAIETSSSNGEITLPFVLIGNPSLCPNRECGDTSAPSPNAVSGSSQADLMVDTLSQQLANTITDPQGSAWFDDSNDFECADYCKGQYGSLIPSGFSNGNVIVGNKYFYIQAIWVNNKGCTLSYTLSNPTAKPSISASPSISLVPTRRARLPTKKSSLPTIYVPSTVQPSFRPTVSFSPTVTTGAVSNDSGTTVPEASLTALLIAVLVIMPLCCGIGYLFRKFSCTRKLCFGPHGLRTDYTSIDSRTNWSSRVVPSSGIDHEYQYNTDESLVEENDNCPQSDSRSSRSSHKRGLPVAVMVPSAVPLAVLLTTMAGTVTDGHDASGAANIPMASAERSNTNNGIGNSIVLEVQVIAASSVDGATMEL